MGRDALQWLKELLLPGNIRQLKNIVERTVLLAPGNELSVADFQKHVPQSVPVTSAVSLPPVGSLTLDEMEQQMILRAMVFHNNRVAKVARALGITRFALYRRLDKFSIPYSTDD